MHAYYVYYVRTIHIISQIIEKGIMKAMQVFFIYNFYIYI